MRPHHLDPSPLHGMALWHMLFVQRSQEQSMVYIRATRQAFKRPSRWEPWNDGRIPAAQFRCNPFGNVYSYCSWEPGGYNRERLSGSGGWFMLSLTTEED
ncbi:hypothetical protein VP01_3741g1, partial [Puccinia sorghi]